MSRSWTRFGVRSIVSVAWLGVTFLPVGCASGDGEDTSPTQPNVVLFASADAVKAVTGQAVVAPSFLFPYIGSRALLFDLASRSILLIESDGTPSLFTTRTELTDATGETTVNLGRMDLILEGLLEDSVVCADGVSGLLLRIGPNGVPAVHATESQVTTVTGEASAEIALPRRNLQSQVIAQDLISREILLFDLTGTAQFFVRASELATVAGISVSDAVVTGWARGGATDAHYAWFNATNSIVRVQTNGATTKWIDGTKIEELFRGIATPRILKMVAPSSSDDLWVLVGTITSNVARGLGVAYVPADGSPALLFTSETDFTNLLGSTYDISDFGFIPVQGGSAFYGVDRATAQALTFNIADGLPTIVGSRDDVKAATGTTSPQFGASGPIAELGILIFDSASQGHILVQ